MSNQVYVSSAVLNTLMDGLQSCASSIAELRGAVRAHITECLNAARAIVTQLRSIEADANTRYQRCCQAYNSCQSRQRYDEEEHRYIPSCASEEGAMRKAESVLYAARTAREQAEGRLQDMEREVGYYEQPFGGEGLMNSLTDDYIPKANNRLMTLNEKVRRYETFVISGVDIGDSSSSVPVLGAPQTKTSAFNKANERLQEKMNRRESGFRNKFSGYCPHCHCCPCICGNPNTRERTPGISPELLREIRNSRTR